MAIGKKEIVLTFKAATEKAQKGIKGIGTSLNAVGKGGKVAQGGLNKMGKGFKFKGSRYRFTYWCIISINRNVFIKPKDSRYI